MKKKKNWIDSFFGGEEDFYGTSYKAMGRFDPEKTEHEVSSILKLLEPKKRGVPFGMHYDSNLEGRILDWCGGWGRHAIMLAREGFKVTLLDFCQEYLDQAKQEAKRMGKSILDNLNLVHADFRKTPPEIQADYAINIFTAGLGYLGEENDIIALKSLFAALKPGARFLVDTMNIFWIVKNFQERAWSESLDMTKRIIEKRRIDFWNHILRAELVYQDTEAQIEKKRETDHKIYSPAELARVLRVAGFKPVELYGDFDGSKFSPESKRIVMISERP